MKSFSLIFAIIILAAQQIKAQTDCKPGYIILNNNDTIQGCIKNTDAIDYASKCEFVDVNTGQKTTYYPNQIKAFRFNGGSYYISKVVTINEEKKDIFLEFLLKGAVNIYMLKDNLNTKYFIEKDTTGPILIEEKSKIVIKNKKGTLAEDREVKYQVDDNQYKGILIYYMNEDPNIQKMVYEKKLTRKNLVNIGKEYHNYICNGSECIDYTNTERAGISFSIGLMSGIVSENYGIYYGTYTSGNGYHRQNIFSGGLSYEIIPNDVKNHFFIDGNLQFGHSKFNHPFGIIDLTYRWLDCKLNYSVKVKNFTTSLGMGLMYYSSHDKWNYQIEHSPITYNESTDYNSVAPAWSVGLRYDINDKHLLKLNLTGDFGNNYMLLETNDNNKVVRYGTRMSYSLSYLYRFGKK